MLLLPGDDRPDGVMQWNSNLADFFYIADAKVVSPCDMEIEVSIVTRSSFVLCSPFD